MSCAPKLRIQILEESLFYMASSSHLLGLIVFGVYRSHNRQRTGKILNHAWSCSISSLFASEKVDGKVSLHLWLAPQLQQLPKQL